MPSASNINDLNCQTLLTAHVDLQRSSPALSNLIVEQDDGQPQIVTRCSQGPFETRRAADGALDAGPPELFPEFPTPSQPIILIIEPVNRRGLFAARLAENSRILSKSRPPFTDAARSSLRESVDPKTILISRKAGLDYDSLRSTVGAAAKITVDESKTRFARWKSLSLSAVSPRMRFPNAVATPVASDAGETLQPPVVNLPDLVEEYRK
jgi:hypothetical protein